MNAVVALLTDGSAVSVRELGPDDVPALLELHRHGVGTLLLEHLASPAHCPRSSSPTSTPYC